MSSVFYRDTGVYTANKRTVTKLIRVFLMDGWTDMP